MKYIPFILALAEALAPLDAEYHAAVSEAKSNDPVATKVIKIWTDVDTAVGAVLKSL